MLNNLLSVLVLGSAIAHIRAEYSGPRRRVYLFKPLTMSLILLIVLLAREPATPFYRYAIIAGLAFSLAGDIFLMLPADRFVAGLGSFLVAHLCYIAAFSVGTTFGLPAWSFVPFLLLIIAMLGMLWPHLGTMRLPVLIYMLVITTMAWSAWNRWAGEQEAGALLAFIGALLFVVSDAALAINRFVGKYRIAQVLILGTYYPAQWLIALSVAIALPLDMGTGLR